MLGSMLKHPSSPSSRAIQSPSGRTNRTGAPRDHAEAARREAIQGSIDLAGLRRQQWGSIRSVSFLSVPSCCPSWIGTPLTSVCSTGKLIRVINTRRCVSFDKSLVPRSVDTPEFLRCERCCGDSIVDRKVEGGGNSIISATPPLPFLSEKAIVRISVH